MHDAPLNRAPADLPAHCDVLVIGAGPAGSAAAQCLAAGGLDVVLVDQHPFPRDKVCGDGLIPDAHRALARLGVLDEVLSQAQPVRHVRCVAPRGAHIDVPGQLAVLPRRTLDLILCRAAARAGAKMFAPLRFVAPIEEGGRVVGAQLRAGTDDAGQTGAVHTVRARWVVLATGAVPMALMAAGMCERRAPSGVALRGYIRNPAMAGKLKALEVVWHPKLKPGYGWIFPCPDGVFNIGVGVASSQARARHRSRSVTADVNLRQVLAAFTALHPPARELVAGGTWLGDLKGAPLRCSLNGARLARAGLLVTGEAAGSTYALTGEGIGKALETGLLAAESLLAAQRQRLSDAAVCARHEAAIANLQPRFAIYDKANSVNARPWLVDLLVWSAQRSPRRLQRMAGVLEETHTPGNLVTVRSFARMLFER